MEITLEKTDIFTPDIYGRLKSKSKTLEEIKKDNHHYELTVAFHVEHIHNEEQKELFFQKYIEKQRSYPRRKDEIIINEILHYHLEQIGKFLEEEKVTVSSGKIAGRKLEQRDEVKIILEDKGEMKEGFKTHRVYSVMADEEAVHKNISNVLSELYSKQFNEILSLVGDRKLLAEILEVRQTDDNSLFHAYIEKCGMILATEEEIKARKEWIANRIDTVLNVQDNVEL